MPTDITDNNGRIDFEKLTNTRDLGDIPASDGKRIKSKCLLRSGMLNHASKSDLSKLTDEYNLRTVIDLRTEEERQHKPDPLDKLSRVTFVNIPILTDEMTGITHGPHDDLIEAVETIAADPVGLMTSLYPKMVLEAEGQKGLSTFFGELLESNGDTILWHCTMGKDRVGITTYLLLSALGVPPEVAMQDYLATNKFMHSATQEILEFLAHLPVPSQIKEGIHIMNSADTRFLKAALDAIETECGSLDAYLHEVLGIDKEKKAELQAKYLTD